MTSGPSRCAIGRLCSKARLIFTNRCGSPNTGRPEARPTTRIPAATAGGGVIAKDAGAAYVSERSRRWLLFPCVRGREFAIGGYTAPTGRRAGFGALLVGYYERGVLRYAGKVESGCDTLTLHRLTLELSRREIPTSPFDGEGPPDRGVHWVKPELVAEIGFTGWSGDGKLRHARFLGLTRPRAGV